MTNYLSEEMQTQLWAGQQKTNELFTEVVADIRRDVHELTAFMLVGRFMLRDIVQAQPDPAAYHRDLGVRILSQLPAKDADGKPYPITSEIKELLSILDPQRGKN